MHWKKVLYLHNIANSTFTKLIRMWKILTAMLSFTSRSCLTCGEGVIYIMASHHWLQILATFSPNIWNVLVLVYVIFGISFHNALSWSQRFFCEVTRKTYSNGGTESHLTAVKYVTWVITLLTNHRGVITIPPIRNEGQTLLKSYWCGTISQLTTIIRGFLSLQRNKEENVWNPG